MWIRIMRADAERRHLVRFEHISLVTRWKDAVYVTLVGGSDYCLVLPDPDGEQFERQLEACCKAEAGGEVGRG